MLHETAQIHQKHIMHFSDHCQAQLLRQTLMRSGTPVLTAGACANECIVKAAVPNRGGNSPLGRNFAFLRGGIRHSQD